MASEVELESTVGYPQESISHLSSVNSWLEFKIQKGFFYREEQYFQIIHSGFGVQLHRFSHQPGTKES